MPAPKPPLTPQSSAEIASQDKPCLPASEGRLKLPPPAVRTSRPPRSAASTIIAASGSGSSRLRKDPRPASPADNQPDRKRRRPSMPASAASPTTPTASAYSLPPPPTRSRTIIQMQPGASKPAKGPAGRKAAAAAGSSADKQAPGDSAPPAKATSAGGKRLARKTAHSVIERRRRSKMNEEFETMKEMIPACKGQTMHKLAILQAGIDYLQYLERCVNELKAANDGQMLASPELPLARRREEEEEDDGDDMDEEDEDEEDDEEEDTRRRRPITYDDDAMAEDDEDGDDGRVTPGERHSAGSAAASPRLHQLRTRMSESSAGSAAPSPVVRALERERYVHSAEASPALPPNASRDADYEATAALLMLNGDRGSGGGKAWRGLSVQDLLSG